MVHCQKWEPIVLCPKMLLGYKTTSNNLASAVHWVNRGNVYGSPVIFIIVLVRYMQRSVWNLLRALPTDFLLIGASRICCDSMSLFAFKCVGLCLVGFWFMNFIFAHYACVVGMMKMGNTVPRAGLEPTSLTFRASVLPLHHVGFPDVITIPTPTCLYSSLPQTSGQTTTLVPLEL